MNDVKYNQQLDAEINWFFKINYLKKKNRILYEKQHDRKIMKITHHFKISLCFLFLFHNIIGCTFIYTICAGVNAHSKMK